MGALMGSTCVRCGHHIRHWSEPTGRSSPPYNVERSEGTYYVQLGGELCGRCDGKVPLKEKDPDSYKEWCGVLEQIEKIKKRGDLR